MGRRVAPREPSRRVTRVGLAAGVPVVVAVVLAWTLDDGGFATASWLPGALVLATVLAVTLRGERLPLRPREPLGAAILLLTAFTGWNALSILWAEDRRAALEGTGRAALYLVVLLVALRPLAGRVAAWALQAYALGVVAVCLVVFLVREDGDVGGLFVFGRLAGPIEYSNGLAAALLMAMWPALTYACRRDVGPIVRGALLAAAGVAAELALLCQSRASLVGIALTMVVWLVLVPHRARALLAVAAVGTMLVASGSRLLAVYEAGAFGGSPAELLGPARKAVVATAVVLWAVGAGAALVDRRIRRGPRTAELAHRGAVVLLVALAIAGTAGAAARLGNPGPELRSAWEAFKSDQKDDAEAHLTSGFGSKRYDLWRVAFLEFRRHPLIGIGTDNYERSYERLGRTTEEPIHPHSLALRLLSQLGLVGTALFVLGLGALGVAIARAYRAAGGRERGTIAAATAVVVYWLVHGAVDFLWEIPALAAAAFLCLGLAARRTEDGGREGRATALGPRVRARGPAGEAGAGAPSIDATGGRGPADERAGDPAGRRASAAPTRRTHHFARRLAFRLGDRSLSPEYGGKRGAR